MASAREPQDRITDASTPSLFAGLIGDAKDLAVGHLERLQGEIGQEFKNLKAYLAQIAIAIAVVVVGAVLVGHALAVIMIALGLPPWAAYSIAAAIAVGVGVMLIKRSAPQKAEMDLIPEDSLAAMKRDFGQVADAARKDVAP